MPDDPETSEAERLEALCALNLLDTPPEERFDRITRLAASFFDVPIALVSLIDEQRQWFKSKYGIDVPETPRDHAFCDHAIRNRDLLVVEDAGLDTRFRANPLVTGPLGIRFYAGYPVCSPDGHILGTLCLIDHKPRRLTQAQIASLKDFARLIDEEIAKSHVANATLTRQKALRESRIRFRATFEQAAVGIAHVGLDGKWLRVNQKLCEIVGYSKKELEASTFQEITFAGDMDRDMELVQELVAGKRPTYSLEKRYVRKSGNLVWINLTVSMVKRLDGDPDYLIAVVEDIEERVNAQRQLQSLNAELERRVEERTLDLAHRNSALADEVQHRKRIEKVLKFNEERIRTIIDGSLDAFIAIDDKGVITDWNSAAETLFGWRRDEAIGKTLSETIIPPQFDELHRGGIKRFIETGHGPVVNQRIELPALTRSGRQIPVEVAISVCMINDRHYFSAFLHDISRRRMAAQVLAEKQRLLDTITNNLPVLIAYLDCDLRYRFANRQYREWLGVDHESMVGRTVAEVFGDQFFHVRKHYLERCVAGETVRFDIEMNNPYRIVESVYIPDRKDQEVVGLYILSTDITAMRQHEAQLSAMARVDALTGLWNRRSYEEKLRETIARGARSGHPIGLLFLDVDYFKRINDTLGHVGGDAVLKEFGVRLKISVRATDCVFRLAGDEFTVILENVKTPADVERVAQKIVEAIRAPFMVADREFFVTTSIGAVFTQPSRKTELDALNQLADEALYEAKGAGRNGYIFRRAENTSNSEKL